MFRKIAVVNRGEPAMRLLCAVDELNAQHAAIRTVAFHVSEEAKAAYVLGSSESYDLGPVAARPFIDLDALESALVHTGVDAVWVGWGFVAENADFAELCERLGVTFIGPSSDSMRLLGDKIASKHLATAAGLPVAPWSGGPVRDLEHALEVMGHIGYPAMLKASAGGGGRGISALREESDLVASFDETRRDAMGSFGSDVLFIERMVDGARHVEAQAVADAHGNVWTLALRDCSIQRRQQKLIEESSSPVVPPAAIPAIRSAITRLLGTAGYCGCATVELLYHPGSGELAFLEVNTRLQVEHPVTEATTGVDLVKLQIQVAAGHELVGDPPPELGHAVEARLNAEDPERDFAPAPGRINALRLPAGPGIRVDSGVREGDVVRPEFDSMLAKVIAWGRDRAEAIARLKRALQATAVSIDGGTTNRSFLLAVLDQPDFVSGGADTGWIDRERARGALAAQPHEALALATAAILTYQRRDEAGRQRLLSSVRGGRPEVVDDLSEPFTLVHRDVPYSLSVARTGQASFHVVFVDLPPPANEWAVRTGWVHRSTCELEVGDESHVVSWSSAEGGWSIDVGPATHRVAEEERGVVRAPSPGILVAALVKPGDVVQAGHPLVVIEAMKMESRLTAREPGVVTEVLVMNGQQVASGQPLVRYEAGAGQAPSDRTPSSPAAVIGAEVARLATGWADRRSPQGCLAELRSFMLGYEATRSLDDLLQHYAVLPSGGGTDGGGTDGDLVIGETSLLRAYADLLEVTRATPRRDDDGDGPHAVPPYERFCRFSQLLTVDAAATLPPGFRRSLDSLMRHHHVSILAAGVALEQAVHRTFLARARAGAGARVAEAVLRRWSAIARPANVDAAPLLDQLATASRASEPAVSVLARAVRHRWYDDDHRARWHAHWSTPAHPDGPGPVRPPAAEASPLPATWRLNDPTLDPAGDRELVEAILGELSTAHHRLTNGNGAPPDVQGLPTVTTTGNVAGRPVRRLSLLGTYGEAHHEDGVTAAMTAVRRFDRDLTPGTLAGVDLYLRRQPAGTSPGQIAGEIADALEAGRVTSVEEVVLGLLGPARDETRFVTLCRSGRRWIGALDHDAHHPSVRRALGLERLDDFAPSWVPEASAAAVYRCREPDDPDRERLFAVCHVHTLGDDAAQNVARCRTEVIRGLESLRQVREVNGSWAVPQHVLLHIWPELHADTLDLAGVVDALARSLADGELVDVAIQGTSPDGRADSVRYRHDTHLPAVSSGDRRYLLSAPAPPPLSTGRDRRRGLLDPHETIAAVVGAGGTFVELDLDADGALTEVDRPAGAHRAGVVVGLVTSPLEGHPDGATRVLVVSDPTRGLGALSEPECSRVVAAIDRAEQLHVPVEWFAVSSGAKIAMDSGTENLDAVARSLRRIVTFTQSGGEINVVVAGINVGGQPYWNAEATMLMHTRGVLVMTPASAMVLTGKAAIEYSGGVAGEDNFAMGGYHRIMGPNGQAQYWAADLSEAIAILRRHYAGSYVAAGERRPRRMATDDPVDRDVTTHPHDVEGTPFRTVGEIFSAEANPSRKLPFDIRTVMRAVADQDREALERWPMMADAETAVVLDTFVGGWPVSMVGIESRPLDRPGHSRSDGPAIHAAGTLYPQSSKKVARAINAASGRKPVVVLANLAGFDGSPESLRNHQLEYGAEIGRAIVNFRGPITFCVISRYHGGAFVVFSKALNDDMTVLALEGSFASVIGGAPAAAVVFGRQVDRRTDGDDAVRALKARLDDASPEQAPSLAAAHRELRAKVRARVQAEVAAEFDAIHTIDRAVAVGSVDEIISPARLRPRIVATLDRWAERHARETLVRHERGSS